MLRHFPALRKSEFQKHLTLFCGTERQALPNWIARDTRATRKAGRSALKLLRKTKLGASAETQTEFGAFESRRKLELLAFSHTDEESGLCSGRKKTRRSGSFDFEWCGREDLNLHGVAPIRT